MNTDRIGKTIREKRKEKGLTQEELAGRLNVNQKTVSRWERGLTIPDFSLLESIATELDTDANELMTGEKQAGKVFLEIDETVLGRLRKLNKYKKMISVILAVSTLICLDLALGYFSSSLKWSITDGLFFPNGIIATVLFGEEQLGNSEGVLIGKLLKVFMNSLVLESALLIAYVWINMQYSRLLEPIKKEKIEK